MLSKNSQLTIITGAKSQAALHSMCSRVTSTVLGGLVVADAEVLLQRCSTSSPPITAHRAVVQTPTWYSPTGSRLYIV